MPNAHTKFALTREQTLCSAICSLVRSPLTFIGDERELTAHLSPQIQVFLSRLSGPSIGFTAVQLFVIDKATLLTVRARLRWIARSHDRFKDRDDGPGSKPAYKTTRAENQYTLTWAMGDSGSLYRCSNIGAHWLLTNMDQIDLTVVVWSSSWGQVLALTNTCSVNAPVVHLFSYFILQLLYNVFQTLRGYRIKYYRIYPNVDI